MREKYESLLGKIEEISRNSYALAEVLRGYCEYYDNKRISMSILADFFKKIREEQEKILNLIDIKTTEIGHDFYLKQNQFSKD